MPCARSSQSRENYRSTATRESKRQVHDYQHERSNRDADATKTRLQVRDRRVRTTLREPPDLGAEASVLVERKHYDHGDQPQLRDEAGRYRAEKHDVEDAGEDQHGQRGQHDRAEPPYHAPCDLEPRGRVEFLCEYRRERERAEERPAERNYYRGHMDEQDEEPQCKHLCACSPPCAALAREYVEGGAYRSRRYVTKLPGTLAPRLSAVRREGQLSSSTRV